MGNQAGVEMKSGKARVLFFFLVLGLEEVDGQGFTWATERPMECSQNYKSHVDKTVEDCKLLCIQSPECTEFSSPLRGQALGCRVSRENGCAPKATPGEPQYVLYKKERLSAQEEAAAEDVEGTGARRRRRTEARRRSSQPLKTPARKKMEVIQATEKKKMLDAAAEKKQVRAGLERAKMTVREKEVK